MPLVGLTSFLPEEAFVAGMKLAVSMPLVGFTSFLHVGFLFKTTPDACVNALSRAHIISTVYPLDKFFIYFSVNALSRAHIISTPHTVDVWEWDDGCQCP